MPSKQKRQFETRNPERLVSNFRISLIADCFGFRVSNFTWRPDTVIFVRVIVFNHGYTFVLKATGLFSTLAFMSRRFSIEVAKDYFNFASAHFLIFANGRREPLHGHNYQVSVGMEGDLDRAGVVLDFISFKPLVKRVCDALDHRTLIQTESSTIKVRKKAKEVEIVYKDQRLLLPRGDVILLPIANTSTELLAEYIAKQIKRKVRQNFPATIRYLEVAVEEARGQRGIFRDEF
jgi:6-pyruvoyltetrahydropterin/6-carboxytetrahydropterin synthase